MTYPKALIVDDNAYDRALALREIEKLFPQFTYWEIIDEIGLQKALKEQKFDIVVTDYQLRWTTGLKVLHRIKKQNSQCPVIMFTGTGSEEIAVRAMKAGLDDYVIKSPKHYIRLAAAFRSAWQKSQQQIALQQIQATYDRFFNRVPLGLYRLSSSGAILEANGTLATILGYKSKEELCDLRFSQFHLESDVFVRWLQQLQKVMANEEFEGQIRRGEKIVWVRHNTIAVKDETGNLVCYEGALADITPSKAAELERIELVKRETQAKQEAEKLNRIKDEFLATLSHELRTPLASIIGWIQLIRSGELEESQCGKALDTIYRNAKAQNQLIDDLLDVSRIIRGTIKIQLEPGNLVEVLLAAIDIVRPTAKAKQIRMTTELESQYIQANIDAKRLQQIFWNLLVNAVKFTPSGGLIAIEVKTIDRAVQVRISDTGQGIATDVLPYIFDRFRQAETKSSTRTQGGLGLGLAIVRHLVETHGGNVVAHSEGIGKGSTFTIELPLIQNIELVALAPPSAENSLPSLEGLTLLVVEDEADTRDMINLILEQRGAKTITADSVAQGFLKYQQHQPDLIISDISMPLEDGYSLIREIRRSNDSTPAIALTAYASEADKQKAIQSGFDLHLAKPIEPFQLVEYIASLVKESR